MNSTAVITLFPQLLIRRNRASAAAAPLFGGSSAGPRLSVAPAFERRDVATLLRLASWIFSGRAANKGITLRVDAPVAGLVAVCDEIRLQRVLENLLTHAIEVSPPNATITLAARQEGGHLRFWIDDEGLGVAPSDLAKLAESQIAATTDLTLEEELDGALLEVCGRIVAAHGGEISMRNRPQGGTHVEFLLPAKTSTFTPSAAPQAAQMRPASSHAA